MDRPLLMFDGDCGFCRRWIRRWQLATGDCVDYAPSQSVASRFPHISPHVFAAAVVLVEPDGKVTSGAEAVFRTLAIGGKGRLLWCYKHLPLFRFLSEWCYQLIARNRLFFSRFL